MRGPKAAFAALKEKCRLRAELCRIQAEIDATVQTLNPVELQELQELQELMAGEVAAADADPDALRQQVTQEAELAKTTRTMQVQIPRKAAMILASVVEERVARGNYPSAKALVTEAIERSFT